MAKARTVYFCQNCGTESPKWIGKCPSCSQWNTFVEETVQKDKGASGYVSSKVGGAKPIAIQEVEASKEERILVPDQELNRVLGGGIVPGSLVLIGGEPGIGKSTLMLQIALSLSNKKVLYVSGEESAQQIKMRADRMKNNSENCFLLTETLTNDIFREVKELNPDILVIDSIQTLSSPKLESAAGSVGQVKECTAEIMRFAKENKVPVFLIGHITKDGAIAGPKVLEHMVDAVLQFEGDRHLSYRILRTTKNRFGSTNELGIYEMLHNGLREVSNPSEILISQKEGEVAGASIGATLEGNRPLLIEIQALVSTATYGTPQRSATGFDSKRLNMLLAVLEKRGGFRLGIQDVFLNIAGGIRVEDPAIDLAVCMAILSSLEEKPISAKTCMAAEIGLGGELRAVNRIENRIAEAARLGFEEILVSKFSMKGIDVSKYSISVKTFGNLADVINYLFN